MLSVKDMVKDNKQITFVHFREGELWYRTEDGREGELWYRTEDGFEFPVPAGDVGNATMLARDKALLFMRYIRRHYEMLSQARSGCEKA